MVASPSSKSSLLNWKIFDFEKIYIFYIKNADFKIFQVGIDRQVFCVWKLLYNKVVIKLVSWVIFIYLIFDWVSMFEFTLFTLSRVSSRNCQRWHSVLLSSNPPWQLLVVSFSQWAGRMGDIDCIQWLGRGSILDYSTVINNSSNTEPTNIVSAAHHIVTSPPRYSRN